MAKITTPKKLNISGVGVEITDRTSGLTCQNRPGELIRTSASKSKQATFPDAVARDGEPIFIHWDGWDYDLTEVRSDYSTGTQIRENSFQTDFPAKIKKILVVPGQMVLAEQKCVVLEAMKMEFTISAPTAGTVVAIHFEAGQTLPAKQDFLTFKPTDKPTESA